MDQSKFLSLTASSANMLEPNCRIGLNDSRDPRLRAVSRRVQHTLASQICSQACIVELVSPYVKHFLFLQMGFQAQPLYLREEVPSLFVRLAHCLHRKSLFALLMSASSPKFQHFDRTLLSIQSSAAFIPCLFSS